LAYDAMEPGLYMDWLFDRRYIMPYPSADADEMIERLLHIQRNGGLDCIIPNLDVELPLYLSCQDALKRHGIRTFLPTREQFRLRSKECAPQLAKDIGIEVPETAVVTSEAQLREAAVKLGFPVMVKGPYYKAYKAHTLPDAVARFHQLAAEWGYPIIVQKVITGTELNLVGLGDGEGGDFGMVAIKKMWITELGKIWTGVTIRHEGMLAAAQRFLKHTKWRGAFELECMLGTDNKIYLIEINPRFPAWTYFATGVGLNLPLNLVRAAMGKDVAPAPSYEAGKLFVRYTYEIVTDSLPLQQLVAQGER
jgi:carbamoyl-phosphate synthase large subunit